MCGILGADEDAVSPLKTNGASSRFEAVALPPIFAQRRTLSRGDETAQYRQVRLLILRRGAVRLCVNDACFLLRPGDVFLLQAETLHQVSAVTASAVFTSIYLDPVYARDLTYWQYRHLLASRADAEKFMSELYPEDMLAASISRFLAQVEPLLDQLEASTATLMQYGAEAVRVFRLWFTVAQFVQQGTLGRQVAGRISELTHERTRTGEAVAPVNVRRELLSVRDALKADLSRRWTLGELALLARLSPRHLNHVFTAAYGTTPLRYLAMLRVREMERLLRETALDITTIGRQVGWRSRGYAAQVFQRHYGIAPKHFRAGPPGLESQ